MNVTNREEKMSSLDLSGIYPPLPTPYEPNGEISYTQYQGLFWTSTRIPLALKCLTVVPSLHSWVALKRDLKYTVHSLSCGELISVAVVFVATS